MNLVSCDHCGLVSDKSKIRHNMDMYSKEDGTVDDDYFMWVGSNCVPYSSCPSCSAPIILEDN